MPRISNIGGGGGLSESSADALYLNESANLSDLDDVATARTNLGLVAGGTGDIWVEKAGDTMTGNLIIGDDHFLNVDGSIVFNETGANADFRVESDTITSALHILGSNGDIGIGTSPSAKLHIVGSAVLIEDALTETKAYRFRTNGGGLDLDFGAASLVLSGFSTVAFGGTQYYYLHLGAAAHLVQAHGAWIWKQGNTGADAGAEVFTINADDASGDMVVFNEGGNNYDLRMESDTNANMFFLDASANKIGIGTTAPALELHVIGGYQLSDALVAAKSYRFRTTGTNLDFDFTGKDMYISGFFPGGDYSGTQKKFIVMGTEFDFVHVFGNWEFKERTGEAIAHNINPDGNVIFNETGGNKDFRIESDTMTHVFFVDASADFIGINQATPLTRLDVNGAFRNTPVTLTDAATIAVNAALGNYFTVTLGGNRTLGNPTNAVNGQRILFRILQDATGNRTLALDTNYRLGADITSTTLSTTASKCDYLTVVYDSTATKWDVIAFVKGY